MRQEGAEIEHMTLLEILNLSNDFVDLILGILLSLITRDRPEVRKPMSLDT